MTKSSIINSVEKLLSADVVASDFAKSPIIESVFQTLPIGIGIYSKEGDLAFANDVFKSIIQASNRKHLCNLLDSPDIPQFMRDSLQADKACETLMYFDGEGNVLSAWTLGCCAVKVYMKPLFDDQHLSTHFMVIAEDVTEAENNRHRLDEALAWQKEHSRQLEQKSAELEALARQRRLILEHMRTGLVYMKPDYTVIWKNKLPMYGNASETMYRVGTHCYEHFGRKEPCEVCPVVSAHKDLQPKFRTFFDPSGLVLDVMAMPVRNEQDGEVEGYILRLDDVTVRENLIKKLHKAKDKAEASERAKMAFLANMSHEVRTPLNAIVGFTDFLNDNDGNALSEEERKEFVRIIHFNVDLLSTLVNDILDMSKLESGRYNLKISDTSLSDLCRVSLESIRHRATDGVELRLDIPEEISHLVATTDVQRVQQLLVNFLTNACKYTSSGSITLGYCVETAMGGELVHFSVTDTGEGIPKDKAQLIFKRFEKLDDFKQGTGLGLNICRLIAEMLNGTVYLDENYTHGSRFVFEMPLVYKKGKEQEKDED